MPVYGSDTSSLSIDGSMNSDPSYFPKFRAALAKMRAGTRNVKVACVGDSTTRGVWSNGSSGGNINIYAYPAQLGAQLAKVTGLAATSRNSYFCNGFVEPLATQDPRITVGTGWSELTGNPSIGGSLYQNNSTTNSFAFQPDSSYDTVDLYVFDGGSCVANINSGTSNATITNTNAGIYRTGRLTLASPTTGVVNITRASGTQTMYIAAIDCYLAATKQLSVYNMGASGVKSGDIANTGTSYAPQSGLSYFAPDLTILSLGINDINNAVTSSSYQTSMQSLITAAQASGDVLLVGWPPSNNAQDTNGIADSFVAVLRSLAGSNKCGLIDIRKRFVSYAVSNGYGYYGDSYHLTQLGYSDMALAISGFLRNICS